MSVVSISHAQLLAQVGATTFARGHDVLGRGKVQDVVPAPQADGTMHIVARTQGSSGQTYQQDIVLDDTAAKLSVRGFCSCPMQYNCKHVVAAVLSIARNKAALGLAPDDMASPNQAHALEWIRQLKPNSASPSAQGNKQPRSAPYASTQAALQTLVFTLEYELTPLTAQSSQDWAHRHSAQPSKYLSHSRVLGSLVMGTYTSRLRANGQGWLKPKALSYAEAMNFARHDDSQAELLRLLKLLSPYQLLSHPGALVGSLGRLAFDLLMTQTHVFLTTADNHGLSTPVQSGPELRLHWQWLCIDSKQADPLWRLDWQLCNAQEQMVDALLYAGPPAVYVDVVLGTAGLVQHPNLSAQQLKTLLSAPTMPESFMRAQEAALRQSLGSIVMPPIFEVEHALEGIKPVARLLVQRVPAALRERQGWCSIVPQFAYRDHAQHIDHTVIWNDYATRMVLQIPESKRRVALLRDADAEQLALQALEDAELVHMGGAQWGLSTPAAQPIWLDWIESDFAALKQLGFEVALGEEMQGFLRTVDTVHIRMDEHREQSLTPDTQGAGARGPTRAESESDSDSDSIAPYGHWFDLSLGVYLDGKRQDILPWLPNILKAIGQAPALTSDDPSYPDWIYIPNPASGDGYMRLNIVALHPWLSTLIELVGEREKDVVKGDALRLSRMQALRAASSLGQGAVWAGAASLQAVLASLQGRTDLPEVPAPQGLTAQLRPYQQAGLNWLQFLRAHDLSGVLADDMGLGKTIQTLAHILCEKQAGRLQTPALVIAPVSLIGNWAREAQRFTPDLRVHVFHGTDRHAQADSMKDCDVVLTSYSLLNREQTRWLDTHWHLVVLDEAQNIKNASSQAAKVVSGLKAQQKVCLSGTPVENHLGELWSLFHFLMPGFLASHTQFTKLFRTPIEKQGNTQRLKQLKDRIAPFMLRRSKATVATELPPKVEHISSVVLSGKQADLYETIRLATQDTVRQALDSKGLASSQITVLDALLKLRQVCCDPRLLPLDKARNITQSAKLELLMDMLPKMIAQGRRVLLFSQFTSMLSLIETQLKAHPIEWVKLTGQSTKRDAIIERFTSGQVPLFLISLKAGGVGLNLPQADTVIHYDPWWNPAVENQATDRAHRIGQNNSVFVYKMVAQGTIEERILALQARKAQLAKHLYDSGAAQHAPLLTEADVMDLLKPLDSI